jgi:CubicO group peptidase (beta-lactamase class C family)
MMNAISSSRQWPGRAAQLAGVVSLLVVAGAGTADARRAPKPEVRPEIAGFSSAALARVDSAIAGAIRNGASPGAALAVGRGGMMVRLRGYGRTDWLTGAPLVTDSTIFDLASLTKPVGTATAAMLLMHEGLLDANLPIHSYLRNWPKTGPHARITVRHLLNHNSGLPAGLNLFTGVGTRQDRIERIATARLQSTPGTTRVYSDVGMILLASIVEELAGTRLDWFLEQRVFSPLAMHDTRFNPLSEVWDSPFERARIAPTELDMTVRRRHLHGEVHDRNAAALDGVAGHAGLFSSARDLSLFAQAILDATRGQPTQFAADGGFARLLSRDPAVNRPLGWDTPNGARSPAGDYFSATSFGHTGFTGTSIWIDPDQDLFVVLLTSRLNPSATNQKHLALRREVHDLVHLALLNPPRPRRITQQ